MTRARGAGALASRSLSDLSYVVVDVETTGGSPQLGDRVTEIAAVVVRDGRITEIYEQMVNPERRISPWITRLTGISEAMVRDQPRFVEIAPKVVDVLAGNIFVAHNAVFDWRFVSAELERACHRPLDRRPTALTLCTVRLARALLPQLPRKSLDDVAQHYGVRDAAHRYTLRRDARHSAAGDAVVTAHCLLHLLDDAADRGLTTWGDVERYSATQRRRARRRTTLPTSTLDDRIA